MSGKYFTGDQKLSKKLIGRTKEALRQRNVQFAQTHGDASDEELLDYVRGEAARLGMTPNAGEIIGGHFIAVRFGCWKNVVTAAGLVPPKKQKPLPKRKGIPAWGSARGEERAKGRTTRSASGRTGAQERGPVLAQGRVHRPDRP